MSGDTGGESRGETDPGAVLQEVMDEANLTAYQLAKRSGVSDTAIRGWLTEGRRPRLSNLAVVAAELPDGDRVIRAFGYTLPTPASRHPRPGTADGDLLTEAIERVRRAGLEMIQLAERLDDLRRRT